MTRLEFELLPGRYAIARLGADEPLPDWAEGPGFTSISRSDEELSVVCLAARVPPHVRQEAGYGCFRVRGPLAFELVGILDEITGALAAADLSLLAVSTFDTDYILLRESDLARARESLTSRGHVFPERSSARVADGSSPGSRSS